MQRGVRSFNKAIKFQSNGMVRQRRYEYWWTRNNEKYLNVVCSIFLVHKHVYIDSHTCFCRFMCFLTQAMSASHHSSHMIIKAVTDGRNSTYLYSSDQFHCDSWYICIYIYIYTHPNEPKPISDRVNDSVMDCQVSNCFIDWLIDRLLQWFMYWVVD